MRTLSAHLWNRIPDDFAFSNQLEVPEEVREAISTLKESEADVSKWQLTGPFLGSLYLSKEQGFKLLKLNSEVEMVRFVRIGPEMVQKCQQVLVR